MSMWWAGIKGKRVETASGTTDASGLFTFTFPVPFASAPVVACEPPTNANHSWVRVSVSPTGFSYRLVTRAVLSVLGLDVLAGGVTNVAGTSVRALVVEV